MFSPGWDDVSRWQGYFSSNISLIFFINNVSGAVYLPDVNEDLLADIDIGYLLVEILGIIFLLI